MEGPPQTSYWLCYNSYDGPQDPLSGNECMISVVLDGDAHASFSAIRLAVVYRESTALRDVTLQECNENQRLGFKPSHSRALEPTHGGRLLLTRRQRRHGATHAARQNSRTQLPIYTIALELVRCPTGTCYTLRPCTHPSDPTLRIAYSHTWPCAPAYRSRLVFLESSHAFIEPEEILCRCCCDIRLPCHSVRIVPTARLRPAYTSPLPPHVVRAIVGHAVNRWARGWRQALLSYALVQKSWLHVLDLYFEGFGTQNVGNVGNPAKIAESLVKKPERGRLISAFCDADFARWSNNNTNSSSSGVGGEGGLPEGYEDAISTILGLATGIQHIEVAKARFHPLRQALARLRRVECFTLAFSSPSDTQSVTVGDVHEMVRDWTGLRKLVLHEWTPGTDTLTAPLPCRLEELQLIDGRLSRSELLSFTSPSQCSLKILKLQLVTDIANADLATLLLTVADTLCDLTITHCTIASAPDEQDAFEATLPFLHRLVTAHVQGQKITCAALITSSKTSSSSTASSSSQARTARPTSLKIHGAQDALLDGLVEAVGGCAWDAVDVHFESQVVSSASRRGRILVRAEEAAARKGVRFRTFRYPFWV